MRRRTLQNIVGMSRYNDDDDDTEDYSPRSRNGYTASLRQTLIAAADKFELEKQRSEAQLRAQIAAERKSLADERKSLQVERAKTAELEMKVKEEQDKKITTEIIIIIVIIIIVIVIIIIIKRLLMTEKIRT